MDNDDGYCKAMFSLAMVGLQALGRGLMTLLWIPLLSTSAYNIRIAGYFGFRY
jgi:hypothetical protein